MTSDAHYRLIAAAVCLLAVAAGPRLGADPVSANGTPAPAAAMPALATHPVNYELSSGDTVAIKAGNVYINDRPLPEP